MTVSSVGDYANCCAGFRGLTLLNSRQRLVILISRIQFEFCLKQLQLLLVLPLLLLLLLLLLLKVITITIDKNNDRKGQDYVYVKEEYQSAM